MPTSDARRLALRRHYAVQVLPGEGVLLLAEHEHHLLRGAIYEQLAPSLDGTSSVDDLLTRLESEWTPEEVYYALERLETAGHLVDGDGAADFQEGAYWDAVGAGSNLAAARRNTVGLRLRTMGWQPPENLSAELERLGLALSEAGAWDLVLVDDYLHPALEAQNREALTTGRPWVVARPVGREVWVGPLFVPSETACWVCLADRLTKHRPLEASVLSPAGRSRIAAGPPSLPATVQLGLGLLATELAHTLAGGNAARLRDRIITYDTDTRKLRVHWVTRRPQCPSCGTPDLYTTSAAAPVRLQHRPAAGDGRSATLADTWRRFRRLVSTVTGIVAELTPHHAGADGRVRAWSAGPNIAIRYRGLEHLRTGFTTTSTGKGATSLEGRVSAMGEAIERYSGVWQGDEPVVSARLDELDGAIHPNACMLFSETQYLTRQQANRAASPPDRVPERFDPSVRHDWTPLWSLTHERRAWLPTALLYYDTPESAASASCIASSNGAAAGNTLEDALLHGLFELVERDAVATWWYNRLPRPAVDPERIDARVAERLRRAYQKLGREFWVLDLTHDLRIPCFVAVSRRVGNGPEEPLFGLGAHLDPGTALRRALSEMNQLVVVRHARPTPFDRDPRLLRWLREGSLAAHPYLAAHPEAPVVAPAGAPGSNHGDIADAVRECTRRLAERGLEVLVLDQTRPDIGVPVIRVVVPGLRHIRPRLAPGRLYDVPVSLGWRTTPLQETALNDLPFLF